MVSDAGMFGIFIQVESGAKGHQNSSWRAKGIPQQDLSPVQTWEKGREGEGLAEGFLVVASSSCCRGGADHWGSCEVVPH